MFIIKTKYNCLLVTWMIIRIGFFYNSIDAPLFCYLMCLYLYSWLNFNLITEHRHVGSTNFNLLSSRSHTIFTLVRLHHFKVRIMLFYLFNNMVLNILCTNFIRVYVGFVVFTSYSYFIALSVATQLVIYPGKQKNYHGKTLE